MPRDKAGVRIVPGPDPTFDAPKSRGARPGPLSKMDAQHQVSATMENYARELSNAVDSGEIDQASAEQKLKSAKGILSER